VKLVGPAGKVAEALDGTDKVNVARHHERLAVVGGLLQLVAERCIPDPRAQSLESRV
jgi:hypothetical protein